MADVLDELLEENARARADLLEAIDAIPADRRVEAWADGRSVKDILSNIIAWQDGWAHALELTARGERPSVPGFEDGDIDAFNAAKQQELAGESWETVMGKLRAARERHDAAVRGLRLLDADRYAPGRTAHRIANVAEHDREHTEEILAWRREQRL